MQFHVLKFVLNCITGTDENYASMLPISRWNTHNTHVIFGMQCERRWRDW